MSCAAASCASATAGAPAPPAGGLFTAITPVRVYDSRATSDGALAAGADRAVPVLGRGGVPASGVSAVVLNLTGVGSLHPAVVQVFSAGRRPADGAASVLLPPGPAVSCLVVAAVGDDGSTWLSLSAGRAHAVIDVVGWYGDGTLDSGTTVSGSTFRPLVPAPVHDTRSGGEKLRAGSDRNVVLLGRGGVPASGVDAVVVNTTVLGSTASTDVQLHPTGTRPRVRTSHVNVAAHQTRANLAVVQVGDGGRISLSTSRGETHVVLDVVGWYGARTTEDPGLRFTPTTPVRAYDSRLSGGPVSAGVDRVVRLAGRAGIPETAAAVVSTVTVMGAARPADVQLFPTGSRPAVRTSNVSVADAAAVPNLAVVGTGRDGAVTISTSAGAPHVVLDVVGWFAP